MIDYKVNFFKIGKVWDSEVKKITGYDQTLLNAVYRAFSTELLSDYACDSFYELSAFGYQAYKDYGGEEFNNLKSGYSKLIDYLNSQLPVANYPVRLNQKVDNINWLNKTATVSTTSANGVKSTYQARFVVSSVSLGVLKSSHQTLFTPALPADKIGAIQRLGFGVVNKIFFVFDKPLFANDEAGLQFLWTNNTKLYLKSDLKCNLKVILNLVF